MVTGKDSPSCIRGFIAVEAIDGYAHRYKAFPVRCKSWDCPHCSRIKANQYKARMQPLFDRPALFMYTFTFYHSHSPLEVWQEVSKAWNRLRTAAAKKYGALNYVRILEHHHASDYPHLHCLIDIRFSDVWLARELKNAGFGYQCVVKKITSNGAAAYVTKYLTKPWTSAACKVIRRNLHLRIISFGGTACTRAMSSGGWNIMAMALNCEEAIARINLDAEWRHGAFAVRSFEKEFLDTYELTVIIPEGSADVYETADLLLGP